MHPQEYDGDRSRFSTRMTRILTRLYAHVRPPRDIIRATFSAWPRFQPPPVRTPSCRRR